MTKKRTTQEFIEICNKIHNNKYDYSMVEYINKDCKVNIICPIHGVFSQRARLHMKGSGCPKCSYEERGKKFKKCLNEFIFQSNIIHNNFYSYDKFVYVDAKTKGVITCPIHGDFEQKPNDHLQGKGCPMCNMSKLEKDAYVFLSKNSINFEQQKKFDWLGKQSLDFYLPEYNIAIECQGKQHFGNGGWSDKFDFNKQKERDIIKHSLCVEHGIKIIYFCYELYDFFEPYTKDNVFYNLSDIGTLFLGIKHKTWINEVYGFYNELLLEYNLSNTIDIYCCDLTDNNELNVSSNYELNRRNKSREHNRLSIHIFEDEWLYKCDIVKSRIRNLLKITQCKIYGRNCVIKEVSNSDAMSFLNLNHIQGGIYGKYNFGLYYNDELVSLMTFGSLRKSLGSKIEDKSYELLRFCNKINTNVVGGASKLFKYFLEKINPNKVISYCDLRWSDGNLYETLGFLFSHKSKPNYFYVDENKRIRENRFKYRKDKLITDGFDEKKSEHEIMLDRGIHRIYDCGCNVYLYQKNINIDT